MALTRSFKDLVQRRAATDAAFAENLLREGVDALLGGDIETGKAILRDYINATVGFAEVAESTHIPPKSLMRMLGPNGNPRATNLLEIVSFLQDREGVKLKVKAQRA